MDLRPIGIFDSGIGGLTVMRELAWLMPEEDLVYFGDIGRVPYGGRSREIIIRYARQDAAFLRSFNPKAIVVACGTVSATALPVLREESGVPVFGVVEPAAHAAARRTVNGRVDLIGTKASIRSGAYERALEELRPGTRITANACPLFVPLVENGRFDPGDVVAKTVATEYLSPVKAAGVDTLILGCTHYPLLRAVIEACMGPEVTLIDAGAECARRTAERLDRAELRAVKARAGRHRFFVSDDTEDFAASASAFLGKDISAEVGLACL